MLPIIYFLNPQEALGYSYAILIDIFKSSVQTYSLGLDLLKYIPRYLFILPLNFRRGSMVLFLEIRRHCLKKASPTSPVWFGG